MVELTSGDWEGIYADNSGYVREAVGGPTGGHWNIQVEEAGSYAFTLRRWPERAQVALGEKYEPSPRSPANKPNLKTVGFPTIAAARIEIAGVGGLGRRRSEGDLGHRHRETAGRPHEAEGLVRRRRWARAVSAPSSSPSRERTWGRRETCC